MSRQEIIETTLRQALLPTHLEVLNESHNHSTQTGGDTHFKVVIVAPEFEGQPLLARHRRINALLAAELQSGLHALSIHAFAPAQWQAPSYDLNSPNCRGGAGR